MFRRKVPLGAGRARRARRRRSRTPAGRDADGPVGPPSDDLATTGSTGSTSARCWCAPREGAELRLQVDEQTGEVQSVMLAGEEGALELRAFAAPRNGDLWSEVRPQIAADVAQHGGTATEREGRWGTELVCQMQVVHARRQPGHAAVADHRRQRRPLAAARDVPGPAGGRARRRPGLGGRPGRRRRPSGHPRDAGRRRAAADPARRRPAAQPDRAPVRSRRA